MSMRFFRVAKFALAAVATLGALSGVILTMQAYELLVEPFRLKAAFIVSLCSVALFVASIWLMFGRRGSLVIALVSAAAMLLAIVLGVFQMGNIPLYEAFQQASCTAGSALCFQQASTVIRLCFGVILGSTVLAACARFFPVQNTRQRLHFQR